MGLILTPFFLATPGDTGDTFSLCELKVLVDGVLLGFA